MVAVLLAGLALCCCEKPSSSESFIRASDAEDGKYVFELALTDSLSSYDISICSRLSEGKSRSLCLKVRWVSPDWESFCETVYTEPVGIKGNVELYRSGVEPCPPGNWKIEITAVDAPESLCGIGLVCKRNGTR